MRTREEQIAALAFKIGGVQASNATKQSAEAHIAEAERRAEQRVRAEIGRDSERLDWFEENCSGAKSQWDDRRSVVEWQVTYGEWSPTIRDAIDAAREVG